MNHKELAVWKESMKLVKEVYLLLKVFPSYEQFGICSQMRRSAVSIPSNIAEGAGRSSDKELLRYCLISQGSLAELETQLLISADFDYIKSNKTFSNKLSQLGKFYQDISIISIQNLKNNHHRIPNPDHCSLITDH